jgi:cytoskeleton protein RodZ
MNSERADQPATPDVPQHGVPGKALAAQREAMGWTVEQVADQLKLAVRQVIALEAGDYASLPGPAVVRGFVRAYAKIVRLDPAPLVAMIPMESSEPTESTTVARPQKPATFNESSRFPLHGKRSSLPVGWIAAAVIVVVAAAAAWHFGLVPIGKGETPAVSTPAAVPANNAQPGTTTEPLQKPDVPLISNPGQQNPPPVGDVQPANGAAQPVGGAAAPAAGAAPTAGAGTGAAAAPAPASLQNAPAKPPVQAATETAVPANALVLNVNEDSWIDVSTAGGKKLISRLVKAGSTETVPVEQAVTMIVGNPKGVNATLRGAAVELPLLPGKTISRVSLK